MTLRRFLTHSEEETIAIGHQLAPELSGVVLLIGDLGAGKTTLAKGIVEGRGAARAEDVSSPTFTLIHQYAPDIYHVDLYRLDDERDVENIGLRDLISSANLVLLEWAERFPGVLPRDRFEIRLNTLGDGSREITVNPLS